MAGDLAMKKATGTADFELVPQGDTDDVVAQKSNGTHEHKKVRDIEPKITLLDYLRERFGDDAGWNLLTEFTVGKWNDPHEAVFGQGDSTTETMRCLHTTDDVVFTDVTTILSSDSGSTTGLFGGDTQGNTIYVGGDFLFSGVKVKVDTIGVIEPENVCAEFWDGTAWQKVEFMATQADFPFAQYGWDLAGVAESQQWRFNFDPYNEFGDWVQNEINGETKYWSRFRIEDVAGITSDPLIEQVKLHTSRFEINANGFTEYFGSARYPKTILSGIENLINNAVASPANESVQYAPGVTAQYTDNEFANGATDSRLLVVDIPEGMDTSVPIEVTVSGYIKGPSTGDLYFQLGKIAVGDGFVYDGSGTMTRVDNIVTRAVSADEERFTFKTLMRVNESGANVAYLFEIRRLGGDVLDTMSASFIATHIKVNGYFWKP